MILALRSCVMVWCAAWYFLMCKPGIIPRAVTCTPRYFALVVVCILPVANGAHIDETPSAATAEVYEAQSSIVSMASSSVSCTLSLPVQYWHAHVPG